MTIKGAIRELMGQRAFAKFQYYRGQLRTKYTTNLRVGNFDLTFPGDHILPLIHANQPYRHLALGKLAAELAKQYPGEAFVDIGANVGDTAAIVASHSDLPMILVEPSDSYFALLEKNAEVFPNKAEMHKVLILSNVSLSGSLVHISGTARLDKAEFNETTTIPRKGLAEIAGTNSRLIKVDTDGQDFEILLSSLDFLADRLPCLYFENEIHDQQSLSTANFLLERLRSIGYEFFLVFDASGLHMVTTTEIGVLMNLNRYLFNPEVRRHLYYYDIACLPSQDSSIAEKLTAHFAMTRQS